jgi:hypothetical protein
VGIRQLAYQREGRAGLAAWLGPGWAVTVDALVVLAGGIAVLAWRPQVTWLGCAALPEACVAVRGETPTLVSVLPRVALAGAHGCGPP